MIQINLLPVRVKKKQELARQFVSVYFLSVGLVLAIIGYLWISSESEISFLKSRPMVLWAKKELGLEYVRRDW